METYIVGMLVVLVVLELVLLVKKVDKNLVLELKLLLVV
jgi:hypothetical protein